MCDMDCILLVCLLKCGTLTVLGEKLCLSLCFLGSVAPARGPVIKFLKFSKLRNVITEFLHVSIFICKLKCKKLRHQKLLTVLLFLRIWMA